jgi:hypothetical protein
MTDLNTRVRDALGGEWDASRSLWEGLFRLYRAEPELFYLLACDGPVDGLEATFRPLADFAPRVRRAVRTTYRLPSPVRGQPTAVQTKDDSLPVPPELFSAVQQFLLEIDGKGATEQKGRDYEGRAVSEAEARFKLGDPAQGAGVERTKARRDAKPRVFRVTEADLASLGTQPAYVSHGLLKCAKKVVLAPTAVYRGLGRGDEAPKRLRDGWAICGKPNRGCDNTGRLVAAPEGMVYVVYADANGYVFDWDWVQENKDAPGHPLDPEMRFGNPVAVEEEFVLDLPEALPAGRFDSSVATPSAVGDCIFCYISEEPSFAERINPDLTVFRSFASKDVTGFKIKNVRRILQDEDFYSDDAPDLRVSVQPILLATLKANQKTSVRIYDVIIEAFRKIPHPPEVHVPSFESGTAELVEA